MGSNRIRTNSKRRTNAKYADLHLGFMAVQRTTVAIRQDFKQQLDQMQRVFERKLDLPAASLSPQVFLYGASSLGVRLLEALDAAKEGRAKIPSTEEIRQNAGETWDSIRTEVMRLQIGVNQEELDQRKQVVAGLAAAAVLGGLILGAAALAAKGGRAP